jgi:phosphatidylserine/phosphatidylglycerophosphate/cardiolipin synthase-like enzyme
MISNDNIFATACSDLIGQVATNPTLADAIISALSEGLLTPSSGPMAISKILKGSPGKHYIIEFLKAWNSSASHLSARDVCTTLISALSCYQLAMNRSHTVDTVWTGPEVAGSLTRRTEAVVREIIAEAKSELLIVGYWLVTSTAQIKELIDLLIEKAKTGVTIRFVFDPSEKARGLDNFSTLEDRWPSNLSEAPRQVFSWSESMEKISSRNGVEYDRKLHAKVIVADRRDALVTSANLTHAGLLQNLEMGFRVEGIMASAVVEHFDLLISEEILELRK